MNKNTFRTLLATALAITSTVVFGKPTTLSLQNPVVISDVKYQRVADDLALHLKLICGKDVPVNPQPAVAASCTFNVGKQPDGIDIQLAEEEGVWMATSSDAVWFFGEGDLGTRHGVYTFLEDVVGVRWPTKVDIIVKQSDRIELKETEGHFRPELLCREIRPGNSTKSDDTVRLWFERMRWGYHNTPPFGHAFTRFWETYGATHPEYFAMNNGRRFPINRNGKFRDTEHDSVAKVANDARILSLCPSNTELPKVIAKRFDGKSQYINICENDAPAKFACHCENCLALDPHPSQDLTNDMGADRYVFLANNVLDEVRKKRADAKVCMYAYNASEQPSVNIKLKPGIVLGIVPTNFKMEALKDYVNRWKAAGMTEFKYRPNRHWYYMPCGLPYGTERHFFDVFKFMYDAGATSFDYDAPGEPDKFDIFRYHNDYILLHAMCAPDKPFEYWERHFADAYAGPDAADDVIAYFRFWMDVWDKKIHPNLESIANRSNWNNFSRAFIRVADEYYSDKDFDDAGVFLAKALKKQMLTPEQRSRIEFLKLYNDHAKLMVKAISTKSANDAIALLKFRHSNGIPDMTIYEQNLGDFCCVKNRDDLFKYDPPIIDLPMYGRFRIDFLNQGEKNGWFKEQDISKWQEQIPTDAYWENTRAKHEFPSAEMRKLLTDYDGIGWYAAETAIHADWKGKRAIMLHFGAAEDRVDVWVNGQKAGTRVWQEPDDYKRSFDIDITSVIDWSRPRQTIIVKITNDYGQGGISKPASIVTRILAP
ncbi:MAG: DUF4838 domain-containing protein [Victivallales bacterium]|nr:DUF4838 domain-containing protein [Victivallales bacterium]